MLMTSMIRQAQTKIPGLVVLKDFLSGELLKETTTKTIQLRQRIFASLQNKTETVSKKTLSPFHNLQSHEYYRLFSLEDGDKRISGQHFGTYGEEGHELNYFIRTTNVPEYIKVGLLAHILQEEELSCLGLDQYNEWNATINFYKKGGRFEWHKDIPSNGEMTMIYSLGAKALFQIKLPEEPETSAVTVPLVSNTFVVLQGDARWEYEHRVVPVDETYDFGEEVDGLVRMSVVLGCRRESRVQCEGVLMG